MLSAALSSLLLAKLVGAPVSSGFTGSSFSGPSCGASSSADPSEMGALPYESSDDMTYEVSIHLHKDYADAGLFKFGDKTDKYMAASLSLVINPRDKGVRILKDTRTNKITFQDLDRVSSVAPHLDEILSFSVDKHANGDHLLKVERGRSDTVLYRMARPGEEVALSEGLRLKLGKTEMRVHQIHSGRTREALKPDNSVGGVTAYLLSEEEKTEMERQCYVCFDEEGELFPKCACVKGFVHAKCLAQWRDMQPATSRANALMQQSDRATARLKQGCEVCLAQLPTYVGKPDEAERRRVYQLKKEYEKAGRKTSLRPELRPECNEFELLAHPGSQMLDGPFLAFELISPEHPDQRRVAVMPATFPSRRVAAELQKLGGGKGRPAQMVFAGGEEMDPVQSKIRLRETEQGGAVYFTIQDKATPFGTLVEVPEERQDIILRGPSVSEAVESQGSFMSWLRGNGPKASKSKSKNSLDTVVMFRWENYLIKIRRVDQQQDRC